MRSDGWYLVNRTGSKIDRKGIVSVVVGRGRTWPVGDEPREFAAYCTDKKVLSGECQNGIWPDPASNFKHDM